MSYAFSGEGALDYFPCRYGASRLVFRGPRRSLERPFIAILGGTETYGKFVPDPYPDLVEDETGMSVVNLGCMNAGPDVFLNDPAVAEIASRAEVTVLQLMGAINVSNRYFAVHPRRNDRFLHATPLLRAMFREVDFTEFSFTRHMLQVLQATSPDRFEVVAEELRATWVERMIQLLDRISGPKLLFWMSEQPPPPPMRRANLNCAPLLVDAEMIRALCGHADGYVEQVTTPAARQEGRGGMVFSPLDALAAAELPGPAAHHEASAALTTALLAYI
jgi:hypothetical protein